jgi:CheY-like chemotaxis protein
MNRHTILLVEDDELDVISVKRSLAQLETEYDLLTAFNGIEALELLKSSDVLPDVILLDLNMPRMNGIEFLKALRADSELRGIRVFVMTTSSESTDRDQTESLGISGYIIKPLNYNDNTKRPDSMQAFVQFHLRKILSGDNPQYQ